MTIDPRNVRVPGWVWVAGILIGVYLAKTYIADSVLVELVVIIAFMILKRLDLGSGELEQFRTILEALTHQVDQTTQQLVDRNSEGSGEVMRSGRPPTVEKTRIVVGEPNKFVRWLVG